MLKYVKEATNDKKALSRGRPGILDLVIPEGGQNS